jgi:hypothetical protein
VPVLPLDLARPQQRDFVNARGNQLVGITGSEIAADRIISKHFGERRPRPTDGRREITQFTKRPIAINQAQLAIEYADAYRQQIECGTQYMPDCRRRRHPTPGGGALGESRLKHHNPLARPLRLIAAP